MKHQPKKCIVCKSEFYNRRQNGLGQWIGKYTLEKWKTAKFCSQPCRHEWMIGKPSNAGKGKENVQWKGSKVGYSGLHKWIYRHLGRYPVQCEACGAKGEFTGEKKKTWSIQFANLDGRYKRNLKDWLRLCTKCHRKHDKMKSPKLP